MKNVRYIGNGAYCYANSTSMLLASIGEGISPSLIEVLTGVGLSASLKKDGGFLYFNSQSLLPDLGISKALGILGFKYEMKVSEEPGRDPYLELERVLDSKPVILGPLDMGYLVYNPNHKDLSGADHFVMAYKFTEEKIWLHDPAGFPHVGIDKQALLKAWKAEKVSYRKGYYRFIHSPERVEKPSKDEIYKRTMKSFREIYEHGGKEITKENWFVGSEAIEKTAEKAKEQKISERERGHFIYFALPLGAKRALDFAKFFEGRDGKLSENKKNQAKLFGQLHTFVVNKEWDKVVESFEELAELEEKFEVKILK